MAFPSPRTASPHSRATEWGSGRTDRPGPSLPFLSGQSSYGICIKVFPKRKWSVGSPQWSIRSWGLALCEAVTWMGALHSFWRGQHLSPSKQNQEGPPYGLRGRPGHRTGRRSVPLNMCRGHSRFLATHPGFGMAISGQTLQAGKDSTPLTSTKACACGSVCITYKAGRVHA